jgi:DNA modification methylase
MSEDNFLKYFNSSVRIQHMSPFDQDAVWPMNIEIVTTRIPIRKRDGYDETMIRNFAHKLKNNMVKNGIVFIICYAPIEAKSRPFEIARAMVDAGFHHIDNIVIQKSWFPGKRSEINLVNSHEYVLYFCNGKVWNLDRIPIKDYLKTDESMSCPGNTWKVETGSLDESIPLDLAELLIRMTDALPGSIIFDPFMKNSSVFHAALKLGHSFYGFESDHKQIKKYKKILDNYIIPVT